MQNTLLMLVHQAIQYENIKFDKNLLIDINISLFKFLLTNLKITEKKIEIKYMKPSNKIIVKKFSKKVPYFSNIK